MPIAVLQRSLSSAILFVVVSNERAGRVTFGSISHQSFAMERCSRHPSTVDGLLVALHTQVRQLGRPWFIRGLSD
jgi:hypothetical protein